MVLVKVVPDDTMAVPGFEHHTFMCSDCSDIERRLVFNKQFEASESEHIVHQPPVPERIAAESGETTDGEAAAAANVPMHVAPPIAPAAAPTSERAPGRGLLRRVLARWRGGEQAGQ
jgi:hypothetical protein